MAQTFPGGGYVDTTGSMTTIIPAAAEPASPPPGIPAQHEIPDRPDPYYVEGLRCAVQMFEPLNGAREMGEDEDHLWWGNVTRYADAMAAYLRSRSHASR